MLALSKGRKKLPDEQFSTFLQYYVADPPQCDLGLVVKKSKYFPYIMDVDKSATKGGILGSPREVLKVVVRVLKSVIGDTRLLFEHRNHMNYHGLCLDIIVDKSQLRIRDKQLTALNEEYPEVDWEDIVDNRVLAAKGSVSAGMIGLRVSVAARNS